MNIRNLLAVGIGSFLISIVSIGHIDSASAAYRRVHASQCHHYYDNAGTTLYNGSTLSVNTTGRSIYCTAPSDSELPHAGTRTLNVHGYAPSVNSTYSMACAKAYNTAAYSCGPLKYWASGYAGVYGVSVTAWANGGSMPLVYNYLPAGAALYGFFMES